MTRRKLTFELAVEELKKSNGNGFKVYLDYVDHSRGSYQEYNCYYIGYRSVEISNKGFNGSARYDELYLDPIETIKEVTWKQDDTYNMPSRNTVYKSSPFPPIPSGVSIKGEYLEGHSYKLTVDYKNNKATVVEIPNEDTPVGTYVKYLSTDGTFKYTTLGYDRTKLTMIGYKDIQIVTEEEFYDDRLDDLRVTILAGYTIMQMSIIDTFEYYFKNKSTPLFYVGFCIDYICKREDEHHFGIIDFLRRNLPELPYKDLSKTMINFLYKHS